MMVQVWLMEQDFLLTFSKQRTLFHLVFSLAILQGDMLEKESRSQGSLLLVGESPKNEVARNVLERSYPLQMMTAQQVGHIFTFFCKYLPTTVNSSIIKSPPPPLLK